MTGPYSTAAEIYWAAGWRGVLPLPARAKKSPPNGYTGVSGVDPSFADIHSWTEGREGVGNIGLRLPLDVIGVDVDAYDGKLGATTIKAAEKTHGVLPPTWRTTSRDDGVSGIRLYRVPPGLAWSEIGDGIETIQRGHRYAVVWPSLHPEGRTYRWIDPSGVVSTVIPDLDDLPSLPGTWVAFYSKGEAVDVPRNSMPSTLAASWLTSLPGANAEPCRRIRECVTADVLTITRGSGSAHDSGCQATARLVRLAAEGHSGVLRVMADLHKAFIDNVTNSRRKGSTRSTRSALDAEMEWRDLIVSAVNLVSADMPTVPSCDCDGGLTALILTDNRNHTTPPSPTSTQPQTNLIDGANALAAQPDPAQSDDDSTDDDQTQRTTWWPRDLGPVLSGEQTEPPPTILTRDDGQPLWYAGKINGLIGESESGKTWVALLAVAQELEQDNRVLYLDFEDAAPGIVSRLRALGVGEDDVRSWLDYCDPAESLNAAASGDLSELLQDRSYSLIVIDGFNAAMTLLGLDLMSNTDVTKFFQLLLRPLAKTGSAIAYVDHIGKNANEDSKGGIGAQAKRAMTTGCVIKVKVGEPFGRGMTGRLGLVVDKDRAGHVRGASAMGRDAGTAVLESDRETGSVVVRLHAPDMASPGQRRQGKRAGLMESICDWLRDAPDQSSKNAIRKSMYGNNEEIDGALAALVEGGWVTQTRAGNGYTHQLVKAYSVADLLASEGSGNVDLARSPGFAQTSPGRGGPEPSNDLARSPHIYIWGEGESPEAGVQAGAEQEATSPEPGEVPNRAIEPVQLVSCKRCFTPTPEVIARVWDGICNKCAGATGLVR